MKYYIEEHLVGSGGFYAVDDKGNPLSKIFKTEGEVLDYMDSIK